MRLFPRHLAVSPEYLDMVARILHTEAEHPRSISFDENRSWTDDDTAMWDREHDRCGCGAWKRRRNIGCQNCEAM